MSIKQSLALLFSLIILGSYLITQVVDRAQLIPQTQETINSAYLVSKVVDGDTIKVVINEDVKTVRIVGVNAPESVDPRKPVECMGKEASEALNKLLVGKRVNLKNDPTQQDQDRYGRLLRFVFMEDGTDVGLWLIKEGFASESLFSKTPHEYRDLYIQAEQDARKNQNGLWSLTACPS